MSDRFLVDEAIFLEQALDALLLSGRKFQAHVLCAIARDARVEADHGFLVEDEEHAALRGCVGWPVLWPRDAGAALRQVPDVGKESFAVAHGKRRGIDGQARVAAFFGVGHAELPWTRRYDSRPARRGASACYIRSGTEVTERSAG